VTELIIYYENLFHLISVLFYISPWRRVAISLCSELWPSRKAKWT